MNRIAVFGAGSVGCYLGGRLIAAGADVLLVGRPSLRNEAKKHGLTVTDWRGYRAFIEPEKVPFETEPSFLSGAEAVLLAVKCRDTANAARQIAAYTPAGIPVISLQNGIRNPAVLLEDLPGRPILAAMIPFNIIHGKDGKFHCGTEGDIILESGSGFENQIAAVFSGAGLRVLLHERMEGVLWSKLLLNLNNAINALAGVPLADELRQPLYRKVLAACIQEGLHALDKAGIRPEKIGKVRLSLVPLLLRMPNMIFLSAARGMLRIDPHARTSMWEDLEKKRPTEIDCLNGEITALADSCGVAAPVNKSIISLIKKAEAAGCGSPKMSARGLLEAVAGALSE